MYLKDPLLMNHQILVAKVESMTRGTINKIDMDFGLVRINSSNNHTTNKGYMFGGSLKKDKEKYRKEMS